jgi:hypothetical protein
MPQRGRRWVAAGLIAAVVVVATWMIVSRRGREAEHPPTPSSATSEHATPPGARNADAGPSPASIAHAGTSVLSPVRVAPAADAAGGALSGRVVSAPTGLPIAGAEVTFATPSGAVSLTSASDGRFELRPPAPGAYQIAAARADGYLPFGPEWGRSPIAVTLAPDVSISDLLVALTPAPEILGRVIDASGESVKGAGIRVLAPRAHEAVLFPLADRFTSDAHGEFRFQAPEGAAVEARDPKGGRGGARVTPEVIRLRQLVVRLERQSAEGSGDASISGRVVLPGGTAVPGALVWVRSASSAYPRVHGEREGYRALSDDEGRFRIDELERGLYDVSAYLQGHAPARLVDIRAPSKSLVLQLGDGARLVGRVTDRSGAAIPAFSLELRWRRGPLETLDYAQASFVDAEGRFEMAGLAAGAYALRVGAVGYASREIRLSVPEGAKEVRADVSLERGGRLEGRVVSARDRSPIQRARISIESGADPGVLAPVFDALTDQRGAFTVEGVPETGASLNARASGYNSRVVNRVRPGAPIVIELTPIDPDAGAGVELVGIGAELRPRADALVIGRVVPGGGASAAGLLAGDEILTIDGTPATEIGFEASIHRIRGPEGSTVVLGVRRAGKPPAVDVPVVRRKISA